MTELTPLLSTTDDALELSLLRSAADDEPADNALPRVATALGVSAAALGAMATAAVAEQALAGGAAVTKHLTLASLAKWLGIGVTAGVVVSGGSHVAVRVAERYASADPPAAHAPGVTPAQDKVAKGASAPTPEPTPRELALIPAPPPAENADELADEIIDEPSASAEKAAPAEKAARPSAASSTTAAEKPLTPPEQAEKTPSSLPEEVKRLDAVREELRSGRAMSALSLLDDYRARYPGGALATEAVVLRVQALIASGDRDSAERQASALPPESRHAARARELLDK